LDRLTPHRPGGSNNPWSRGSQGQAGDHRSGRIDRVVLLGHVDHGVEGFKLVGPIGEQAPSHIGDPADRLGLGQGNRAGDRGHCAGHLANRAAHLAQHWCRPSSYLTDAAGGPADQTHEFLAVLGIEGVGHRITEGFVAIGGIGIFILIEAIHFVVSFKRFIKICLIKAIPILVKFIGAGSPTDKLANPSNQAADKLIISAIIIIGVILVAKIIIGLATHCRTFGLVERQIIHDICFK
jgi:hypothetical protein